MTYTAFCQKASILSSFCIISFRYYFSSSACQPASIPIPNKHTFNKNSVHAPVSDSFIFVTGEKIVPLKLTFGAQCTTAKLTYRFYLIKNLPLPNNSPVHKSIATYKCCIISHTSNNQSTTIIS